MNFLNLLNKEFGEKSLLHAPGDYSATMLADIKIAETAIWTNPQINKQYQVDTTALRAIIANQTANIGPVINAKRIGQAVSITWLNAGAITTRVCSVSCTPDGTKLETQQEDIDLTLCREATPFKVSVKEFEKNVLNAQQVIAAGQLKQAKELDQFVTRAILAKAVTFGGTNEFTGPVETIDPAVPVVVSAGGTNIPAAAWRGEIIPYLELVADMNAFASPYLIHGTNIYQLTQIADALALNDNQRSIQALLQRLPQYWDPRNMTAAASANLSLMIDGPAVAFAALNYFGPNIFQPMADRWEVQYGSRNLPGVNYDVEIVRTCEVEAGVKHYYDYFAMKLPKYDLIKNPANFSATNTGVLEFYKVPNA